MDPKSRANFEAAVAEAREHEEKVQDLNDEGLCHKCQDQSQNPYLGASLCLECWESHDFAGCHVKGCPNSSVGTYNQAQYCDIHLADQIHKGYNQYLDMKSRLCEQRNELEDWVQRLEEDPRDSEKPVDEWSEEAKEFHERWIGFQLERQEVGVMRSIIENAMESLDEPFHENYQVFG